MKIIKKAIKLLVFISILALAGVGIGLSGGVPIPLLKHRRDFENETIELVEEKTEESDAEEMELKG